MNDAKDTPRIQKQFFLGLFPEHFTFKGKEYHVIGTDVSRDEIECQTVPFDNRYYWFKVCGRNRVRMI